MALALRHRDNTIAEMPALPQLFTRRETDPAVMARIQGKSVADMARRFEQGHRAYVACWNGEPVSWGWVATREAEIGELRLRFAIPAGGLPSAPWQVLHLARKTSLPLAASPAAKTKPGNRQTTAITKT